MTKNDGSNPNDQPRPAHPPSKHLTPIPSGWALECCAFIDQHLPGFLVSTLQSKPVWRNALFATLAKTGPTSFLGCENLEESSFAVSAFGKWVQGARPREIVELAWGSCPDGLLGAFERLAEPFSEPCQYATLFDLLTDPGERRRQTALAYCGPITGDRLAVLMALDPCLTNPRLFARVRTVEQAQIANEVLSVVVQMADGVDQNTIYDFLAEAAETASLNGHLRRLIRLIKSVPPLPFVLDPKHFRHLRTLEDFERTGHRFGNCLATKFYERAVPGNAAYLEFLPEMAIAVLIRLQDGWVLSRVHAPQNRAPRPELRSMVRDALARADVPCLVPATVDPAREQVALQFDQFNPLGFDWDCLEGEEA